MADAGPTIMLAAGEASGDLHAATLCRALRALAPGCRLLGLGGARMAEAGLERVADVTAHASVGGTETFAGVPELYRAWRSMRAALERERPDALVLVDFPEFNLRLARAARRRGVPVVYFIPPQVWVWRPWRVRALRRHVSRVLAVFPFEVALYRQAGVPVAFVGHPVLDALAGAPTRAVARQRLGLDGRAEVLGLLPGSRAQEVGAVLPVMRAAVERIRAVRPGVRVVLGRAPTIAAARVAEALGEHPRVEIADGAHEVMRAADVLLVSSGTATLEAALLGTPMVVCYRLSRLTEAMVRALVRVPWISLVNIVLGRAVVTELYQRRLTPERLAAEALALLAEPGARDLQRRAFAELAGALGEAGVGTRAAREVLAVVGAARAAVGVAS